MIYLRFPGRVLGPAEKPHAPVIGIVEAQLGVTPAVWDAIRLWYANTSDDFQMSGYPTKVRHTAWSADSRYFATGGGEALIT